ncbi:MAG: beta-propeller fold lactonase family protein, partial [Acidobacteria bacterium]|nr:beta-propeller fold lactonase family protein [Acidobacteriota bacterium]
MPTSRRASLAIAALAVFLLAVLAPVAQRGPAQPDVPGVLGQGVTLLPNGWKIAPAGRHLTVGDLPLALVQSADGRFLIITNNGHSKPTLTVVDLKHGYVKDKVQVEHAWLGLAWHPDGRRLFSSGASQNTVNEFGYNPADGKLTLGAAFTLTRPEGAHGFGETDNAGFIGGVAVSPDGRMLYAVHIFGKAVSAVDIRRGRVRQTIDLAAEPYTCLVSPDGKMLYVSLWGGAKVLLFDAATLAPQGEVAVGQHPNAMLFSKDGARLFVACANTNAVWVIDLASKTAREQISVALYPNAPAGTTPNGLGLSPDGTTLLVANADNNTVAVVDVRKPDASEV